MNLHVHYNAIMYPCSQSHAMPEMISHSAPRVYVGQLCIQLDHRNFHRSDNYSYFINLTCFVVLCGKLKQVTIYRN